MLVLQKLDCVLFLMTLKCTEWGKKNLVYGYQFID
jgi:hypothetical protein